MNIAIMIPSLGGGGAERVAQTLGDYYVEQGNKVYYFLLAEERQDYSVKGKVIRTHVRRCMQEKTGDANRMFVLFRASLEIRRLKRQYAIDIAISFMEEFNYLNVLSKGKERVITRVGTVISQRDDFEGVLYKKALIRFFYSKADKVIVVSHRVLRDMHVYYKVPLKKLVRIPNFVIDFEDVSGETGWPYGAKTVLCVGRLAAVKQQERIIRAFSYVCRKEPNAKLIILGRGPQLRSLKRICREFRIEDKVIFEGFTDNISYYYKNAKVYVMASKVEGFPNSMLEAMSFGLPVISTDSHGGCSEIIGKPKKTLKSDSIKFCKYGILIPDMPCGNVEPGAQLSAEEIILGDAVLNVLTDDNVYRKYREQSFRRAKMFSVDKVIGKWNKILYEQ